MACACHTADVSNGTFAALAVAHLGTADCCIHPPGRNEMIAITPPINFFLKEVSQNRPPLLPRQQPPSPPETISDQISGDEARMNFQISRALPTGGLRAPRQDRWQWFLSPKLLCDALHRASPDPERPRHLQDAHALRKLLLHLAFGCAVDLRSAELHALGDGALEPCFDPLADHRPLKLSKGTS